MQNYAQTCQREIMGPALWFPPYVYLGFCDQRSKITIEQGYNKKAKTCSFDDSVQGGLYGLYSFMFNIIFHLTNKQTNKKSKPAKASRWTEQSKPDFSQEEAGQMATDKRAAFDAKNKWASGSDLF